MISWYLKKANAAECERRPMSYKAIIFDLDGTLLNTLNDLGNAMNRVLSDMGFPIHAIDEYRSFIGDGVAKLIKRALPEKNRNEATVHSCTRAFLEDYHKNWNVTTRPYKGIPELLDTLKERGLKIAVFSNKPHDTTTLCVAELLPMWQFDAVLGHRDGIPHKPNPAGAIGIANRLNLPPRQFLYLGDSGVDMETAIAADMFPVGALWGFRDAEELRKSGAQALISQPLELLDLLE
jgi:phosphoglycolate phosphatase